jgi:hypothetical protein
VMPDRAVHLDGVLDEDERSRAGADRRPRQLHETLEVPVPHLVRLWLRRPERTRPKM